MQKKNRCSSLPLLEGKQDYLARYKPGFFRRYALKRWYRRNMHALYFKVRLQRFIRWLSSLRIPLSWVNVARWVLVDLLRAKRRRFWGIYQFVALPGQGKTLSMVAHMERARTRLGANGIYIATNFGYRHQQEEIRHWSDIIRVAKYANAHHLPCIIGIDEIHTTFDASDWRSFPPELLALLSFNRKFELQFLCSSQIYERIPTKIRDIANYTVICKNVLGLDRYFIGYYFSKSDYEDHFSGKRVKATSIKTFVADDELYSLYDTLAQVDKMTEKALEEQSKKKEAFKLLFGDNEVKGTG